MQETHSPTLYAKKWKRNFFLLTGFPLLLLLNGYAWLPTSYPLFFEFFLSKESFTFIFLGIECFIGLAFYSFYSSDMKEEEQKETAEETFLVSFFLVFPLCLLILLPVLMQNIVTML